MKLLVKFALMIGVVWSPFSFSHDKSVEERLSALENRVRIGGRFRMIYDYREKDDGYKDQGGKLTTYLMQLTFIGNHDDRLSYSADYRMYDGNRFFKYADIKYQLTSDSFIRFGQTLVPFGILPYDSHNYWFGISIILG